MMFETIYTVPKEAIYNFEIWENNEKKCIAVKTIIIGENDFCYLEENGSSFPKLDVMQIFEEEKQPLINDLRVWYGNVLPNNFNL